MGRQTLRQLSPTIWHQAPELASKYHRRRLLAMHAMERDTQDGLYVLRHDSHASCQHPEVYGRPWENRSRTAAYLLETADRTTCKRQYEILDRLRTMSAQTEIGCGDSESRNDINGREKSIVLGAACETPGACGLAQSSILLVNTHLPWIADWMPALEDRRHAERWK